MGDSSGFLFVRHGQTEPNALGQRCGGDLDVVLTDQGCEQTWKLGWRLRQEGWSAGVILCSDLVRVRQTAMILSGLLGGLELISTPLLSERRLGAWNRQPITETEEALRRGDTPPGGEAESAFRERILSAARFIDSHIAHRPLVVSSKGVGRVLNTVLGGADRLMIGNAELVQFSWVSGSDGRRQVSVHRPWLSVCGD